MAICIVALSGSHLLRKSRENLQLVVSCGALARGLKFTLDSRHKWLS